MTRKRAIPDDDGPMIVWSLRTSARLRKHIEQQAAEHNMAVGAYLDQAFAKRGGWAGRDEAKSTNPCD